MWSSKSILDLSETSRQRCLFSSSNTSRQSSAATAGNQGRTSAMKKTMSNVVFGMAAAALSNRSTRLRCYFEECAGSKVIEISLKPSRRL
jgi:hypothetical protein